MSIHKTNGKYKVRWREGSSNRARTFDLKRDAVEWDHAVARRRQLGPLAMQQLTERHGPTLGQWVERHWAPEHGVTLAQSTRDRYANVYAVHIAPTLDAVPLAEITVGRVREWQSELIRDGVNVGSIDKARTLLSSILRNAAEAEAIPANPVTLVRAPAAEQHEAVVPLAPTTVETIRRTMLKATPIVITANSRRRRYELPAVGSPQTRSRDALIVSTLAYAGLRAGELRALRWSDVGENTITVQRACNPDGSIKPVKAGERRSVRLLAPLAQDLREYRLAAGRPPENSLILPGDDGQSWTKSQWQMWRVDRWAPACRAVGLKPLPRPYDLRHSFASLLLAERHQLTYVARQLGHSVAVLLSTYGHLFAEYEDRTQIDAEAEIREARSLSVPKSEVG